ncbi:MAG: penicillin-binding protein 1C [Thalassovita sp.]
MGAAWVSSTVLPELTLEQSVEVRDRNGDLLRAYTVADGRWRLPVKHDQVDARFLRMLLAYEDKRFYQHAGVDGTAMVRALAQALRNGKIVSGGSTLTMQVARLLEEGSTGAWSGKLRQIRVALALEQRISKAEILDLYLSLAPYGGNIEGVRAATLSYFGKEPGRLTPAQAALLVALPQAPEGRRPDRYPDRALAARERVLHRMVAAQVLTAENVEGATRDPIPKQRLAFPALAPHVADRMRQQNPDHQRHNVSLDRALQSQLQDLAQQALIGLPERMSIAILAADHTTGEILASVGSGGYLPGRGQGFVDMTQALRSPGSTLKPLVYALGMDQGLIHPETLIDDRPIAFGSYAPQNFDGQYRGELKVAEALRLSLNIPVVALVEEIGPPRLVAAMQRAGMTPVIAGREPGLAVALGGVGVTLQDLVGLYAGLAQGGRSQTLHLGDSLETKVQFVGAAPAWQVGHILSGLLPPKGAITGDLAYKTGTSYGHRDAWAVGYDGTHVIGVWMGRPDGTPVPGVFGGDLAAPVLFESFGRLKPRFEPLPVPPPETLLVRTAQLPQALQRFRSRHAVFQAAPDAPKLAFPPDGAALELEADRLVVKLRDGAPPFTWLANGVPVLTGVHRREAELDGVGAGFMRLTVIDAEGRSDRVQIRID